MMSAEKLTRIERKMLAAARELAAPDSVLAYARGTGRARMSTALLALVAGFVAVFVAALLLFHAVLLPGVVLLFVAYRFIRPRRGMALCPREVLLLHESTWSGKPNRVLARATPDAFVPSGPANGSHVTFDVGAEQVEMKRREYERVQRLLQAPPLDPGAR